MARKTERAAGELRPSEAVAEDDFAGAVELALTLPDVKCFTSPRGMSLRTGGQLLACQPIHASAEPRSLMVCVSRTERARLLAENPAAFYVTPHYQNSAAILVRLSKVHRDALRDVLGAAWLFVSEKSGNTSKAPKRRAKPKPRPKRRVSK